MAFQPRWGAFFFSCERRRRERACGILLKMYLFLPSKKTQDASVFPAEELASAGWLNPQKLGRGDCDGRERDAEKEGVRREGEGKLECEEEEEGRGLSSPLPAVHGPRVVTARSCWIIMVPEKCSSVLRVSVSAKDK